MPGVIADFVQRVKQWRFGQKPPAADSASRILKIKYSVFKDLLASNAEMLTLMSDIQEKLRGQTVFDMSSIRSLATRSVFHTLRVVKSLDDLSGHKYPQLFDAVDSIKTAIDEDLGRRKELPHSEWILPYSQITKEMVDWVGGKSANLGELLNKAQLPIPDGFAITTRAYDYFLAENDLFEEIIRIRRDLLDPSDPAAINLVSDEIHRLILSARVPPELEKAMGTAYEAMANRINQAEGSNGVLPKVALRSSAIGEDSELSFAGQYLSVLNVPPDKIAETYKSVIASLYNPRAISYRLNKGMRDEDIAMSVACIRMIDSVASGVMYSQQPHSQSRDTILINAVWGLGPYAVDGVITPDRYVIAKDESLTILENWCAHKPVQLVSTPNEGLAEEPVSLDKQDSPCLSPEQIKILARYALILEDHYQCPQDVEWAVDQHGRLVVLQTRPLHLEEEGEGFEDLPLQEGYPLLLDGASVVFPGVGSGPAFVVRSEEDLAGFPFGAVLVAKSSDPQFVVVMQKAQAIVTEGGSPTGHMACVAREFGVPTILDAVSATSRIPQGSTITVDAYSGRVYDGRVPELVALQKTRESPMKDTPVYKILREVANWIVPLNLIDPRSPDFTPEHCKTLHDVIRLAHEFSYEEMFQFGARLSERERGGALKLIGPIPIDLQIIDLGGGLADVSAYSRRVTVDQIASAPFAALLKGMLNEDLRSQGPRAVDLGGFLSVMREQMLSPADAAQGLGDRSYAIISSTYLNFSSRIGYHFSVLDAYCGATVNKNYITFSFKGGAADDVRRERRARSIATILEELGFTVEAQGDRVSARLSKHEQPVMELKLEMVGRMLQFTRQADMLMASEATVKAIADRFLSGNYVLDDQFWDHLKAEPSSGQPDPQS